MYEKESVDDSVLNLPTLNGKVTASKVFGHEKQRNNIRQNRVK